MFGIGITFGTIIWLAMVGALLLVPFGIPGIWIMLGATTILAFLGSVTWGTWFVLLLAAGVAEAIEFLALKKVGERYGASKMAFWGAILGGFVGMFVGVPIPFLGPVITALLGSFAGAAVVTLMESGSLGKAGQVGFGTLMARILAIGVKVAAGVFILVITGLSLLLS